MDTTKINEVREMLRLKTVTFFEGSSSYDKMRIELKYFWESPQKERNWEKFLPSKKN